MNADAARRAAGRANTFTAMLRASASHSMHVSVARSEMGSLSLTVDVTVQIARDMARPQKKWSTK